MKVKRLLAFASVLAASLAAPGVIGAQQPPQPAAAPEVTPAQQPPDVAAESAPAPAAQPPAVTAATISRAKASQKGSAQASQGSSVAVGDYFYSPSTIEVGIGDRVTWTNNGDAPEGHTVTGDGFDSGVFKQGESYSHAFASAGEFDYICTLHPNMKGVVRVGRSAGGNGGGGSQSSGGAQRSAAGAGTAPAFGPNSESAAGSSSGAAGDGGSLPATGSDPLLLALYGIVLLELGFAVRLIARDGFPRLRRR